MTQYILAAEENYTGDELTAIDAGSFPFRGNATQDQFSTAYDPVRRKLIYSVCWQPVEAPNPVNATGATLWSGVNSIAPAASYSGRNFRNFSLMSKSIDTGLVTEHAAEDPASLVPSGIGGSDGTWRRFVESRADFLQGIKITDPRTGNVWSHQNGAPGASACVLYEYRLSDNYALTISPYDPGADRHLELFGINGEWVVFGDYQKDTANRYTLECAPRVRHADEVAADYILSFASFEMPSSFDGATNAPIRSCVDLGGDFWFAGALRGAGARDYRLAKFVPPAVVANPAVGGSVTDVTPWGSSDGPNTDAADYTTSSTASTVNGFILRNQISVYALHDTSELVYINRLYPEQKNPVSTNRADLKFQATYVKADLSYSFVGSFITGYMTAAWAMATDPNAAAYAVYDMRETDLYRDCNGYDFTSLGIEHDKRWFSVVVRPVTAGVIGAASTLRIILAQYQFVYGVAPALTAWYDEAATWDPAYPAYATALGNTNILYGSMAGNVGSDAMLLGDAGLYDPGASSFWYSGEGGTTGGEFNRFETAYNNREGEEVSPPFMKLTIEPDFTPGPAGQVMVHTRIGAP